jgi:subtilisin family serine protease
MTEPTAGKNGKPGREPGRNGAAGRDSAPRAGTGTNRPGERFLVAPRPGGIPIDDQALADLLRNEPGVRVVGTVGSSQPGGPWPPTGCPPVLIVEAPADTAARWTASPQLLVEPDLPLAYTHPNPVASPFTFADPGVLVVPAEPEHLTVVVRGGGDVPLPGAAVYLTGAAWPVAGTTDQSGRAVLPLPPQGASARLWVRPRSGHWPVVLDLPEIRPEQETVVTATPLDASFETFPKRKLVGWAHQALRLHQVAPTFRGHGVRVALIDSGVTSTHPELEGKIASGIDLVGDGERGWSMDTLGHGTACAGVIAAADDEEGIDGIAMDAELHVIKAMPGGRLSHLLQALDHCIRQQVDVAQVSVGTLAASELVALKLAEAREAGVLVVAPAGDTNAGPVTFPARLPTVLAVGAVGQLGTFPPDSYRPTQVGPDALFVPAFTAAGPQVDLCAPGTAVISTVPPDGYAPCEGTGIAAAHVTALAALVLAHHDAFRDQHCRGPARVDRLAEHLRASCRPAALAHSATGRGIPDAGRALAAPQPGYPDWTSAVMSQLRTDLTQAGLLPAGPGTAPPPWG